MGIIDRATQAANISRLAVSVIKNTSVFGKSALFNEISDAVGFTSIAINGTEALTNLSQGNYGKALWGATKVAGTIFFDVYGGEEATLAFKGTEVLWNLATTEFDYKTGN